VGRHPPAFDGPDGVTADVHRRATTEPPWRRRFAAVIVAVAVVAADQTSKTWALSHAMPPRHVLGPLTLELTFNSGAAFGLGGGASLVVEIVVVALVVGLVAFGHRTSRHASPSAVAGLGLLVGGATGNLIDRVVRDHHGSVIDFIAAARIGTHDRWPIFNVADAMIVLGAVTLAVAYSTRRRVADRQAS